MSKILQQLCRVGTMPVVSVKDTGEVVRLASTLAADRIPAAEVTFRTQAGGEVTRLVAENCPQTLAGVGTILNVGQYQRTLSVGAKFIASPGYDGNPVSYCLDLGVPVVLGCANASDLDRAVTTGLGMVKSLPAEQASGLSALKALALIFPRPSFMSTGGTSVKDFPEYLGHDRVRLCGGSWMTKSELIEGEQWDKITALCRQAVRTMLNFALQHVDLSCGSADTVASTVWATCRLFGLKYRQSNISDFVVPSVECCKAELSGTRGHIAIGVPDIEQAESHLGLQDTEFLEHIREVDDKGRTKVIYLDQAFVGFVVHLVRR